MPNARIAVTGAGGFIGSTTVETLLSSGASVRAHLGPSAAVVHPCPPEVETHAFDITDRSALREFMRDINVVVHAAGPPSVAASLRDPAEFARAHVQGTAVVLEAMRDAGVRFIVYVSSAEVYGRSEGDAVAEDRPLDPRSAYAAAKVGAEAFVRAAAHTAGIAGYLLRPFSVFGPRGSITSLFGTIYSQLLNGDTVVLNDLRPVRDFCHVADVANAIVRASEHEPDGVIALNVGTGVGTSVAALAQAVGSALGQRPIIRERDGSRRPVDAEIHRLIADTRKIASVLQWEPERPLAERIRETVEAMDVPA